MMTQFVQETDRIDITATAEVKAVKTGGKPMGIAVAPKTAAQDTVTVMLVQAVKVGA